MLLEPILRAATGVACLKLCYNHLRDGGAEAVSTAIERHPSLHTMDLGEHEGVAVAVAVVIWDCAAHAALVESWRRMNVIHLCPDGPTNDEMS